MTHRITAIYGVEPCREGEYPDAHIVGSKSTHVRRLGNVVRFEVSRIDRREENFGDHGLVWYDVYEGDVLRLSMQGRAVAEVHYGDEVEA